MLHDKIALSKIGFELIPLVAFSMSMYQKYIF